MLFAFLVILLLAAAAGAYYYFKRRPSDTETTTKAASPAKPDPIQDLLALNLDIRKAAMPTQPMGECERVIDKLVALIPRVNEADDPAGELAWTVNRIASEYLPNKCVRPYLQLSPTGRAEPETAKQFEQSLSVLNHELDEVDQMLSGRDRSAYDAKAKFLKHRFNSTGDAS